MNNQLPAVRPDRVASRQREIAQAIARDPDLNVDAKLAMLKRHLKAQRIVATASLAGRITDVLERDDFTIQQRALDMLFQLSDDYPAKAVRVDGTMRVEQLAALAIQLPQLAAMPVEQLLEIAATPDQPALEAGEDDDGESA